MGNEFFPEADEPSFNGAVQALPEVLLQAASDIECSSGAPVKIESVSETVVAEDFYAESGREALLQVQMGAVAPIAM